MMSEFTELMLMGKAYFDLCEYSEAELMYSQALAAASQQVSPEVTSMISGMQSLATVASLRGHFDKAEFLFESIIDILRNAPEFDRVVASVVLNNYAGLLLSRGIFAKAEALFLQAHCALGNQAASNPEIAFAIYSGLAECRLREGSFDEVRDLLKRALSFSEATGDPNYAAVCLNNLANLSLVLSKCDEAVVYLEAAFPQMDPTHRAYPTLLNNMAMAYFGQGDQSAPLRLLTRSLELLRGRSKVDLVPLIGTILNNMGKVSYDACADNESVERFYRQALSVMNETVGLTHPNCAVMLTNLANLYCERGELTAASDLLSWAMDILREFNCSEYAALDVIQGMALISHIKEEILKAENFYSEAATRDYAVESAKQQH